MAVTDATRHREYKYVTNEPSTFNIADMDRRRRRELPEELYDEIIGFLWNDPPSLKSCSLANRIMTVPSQKRLFYCIALRPPLQKLNLDIRIFGNGLCGTSYNFQQLLLRSPHIAEYVISFHIVDHRFYYASQSNVDALEDPVPGNMDDEVDDGKQYIGYKLPNGQGMSLGAPLVPIDGDESRFRRWLPTDRFLPLCAPLLHNLRSLSVVYDQNWYHYLSGRVLITLLNLIQLRSLRHLKINCGQRPDTMIKQAIGENVEHLVLYGHQENGSQALLRLPHPSLTPVYLDSLSIRAGEFSSVFPDGRAQISRLRKLVIREYDLPHVAIRPLLQICSATLQDLQIWPNYDCKSCISKFTVSISFLFDSSTSSRARCSCHKSRR